MRSYVRANSNIDQQGVADLMYRVRVMHDLLREVSEDLAGGDQNIVNAREALINITAGLTVKLGQMREMDLIDEARRSFHA